jgi:hypothetical protein
MFFNQALFDSIQGGDGILFDSTLGATAIEARFTNSWVAAAGGASGNGIHISGGQKISWVADSTIRASSGNGILIDSANVGNVLISDSFITNNNTAALADAHGIYITAAASDVRIQNNRIGNFTEPFGGTGNNQLYGVKVTANAPNLSIENNDLNNNFTGPLSLTDSNINVSVLGNLPFGILNQTNGGILFLPSTNGAQFVNHLKTLVTLGTDDGGNVTANASVQPGAGITVASLPSAASNAGKMIYVTDSTAIAAEGQTCAGSSTNKALAFSNGSVWKCF